MELVRDYRREASSSMTSISRSIKSLACSFKARIKSEWEMHERCLTTSLTTIEPVLWCLEAQVHSQRKMDRNQYNFFQKWTRVCLEFTGSPQLLRFLRLEGRNRERMDASLKARVHVTSNQDFRCQVKPRLANLRILRDILEFLGLEVP